MVFHLHLSNSCTSSYIVCTYVPRADKGVTSPPTLWGKAAYLFTSVLVSVKETPPLLIVWRPFRFGVSFLSCQHLAHLSSFNPGEAHSSLGHWPQTIFTRYCAARPILEYVIVQLFKPFRSVRWHNPGTVLSFWCSITITSGYPTEKGSWIWNISLLVGLSTTVWSYPCSWETARQLYKDNCKCIYMPSYHST